MNNKLVILSHLIIHPKKMREERKRKSNQMCFQLVFSLPKNYSPLKLFDMNIILHSKRSTVKRTWEKDLVKDTYYLYSDYFFKNEFILFLMNFF